MSCLFCCFKSRRNRRDDNRQSSMVPSLRGSSLANAATNLTRIFEELKCPICFNVCVPPIHNCVNGHIVCNNCRQKGNVTSCPTCREGLMGARNYFAENFILNYAQQCRYASQGCEHLRLKGCCMKPHEEKCMFRPVKCIVGSCGLHIPYKNLLSHLDCAHKASGSNKLPAVVQFKYDTKRNCVKWLPYYIETFGNSYYVMMQHAKKIFWVWVYSQPSKEADDLEYSHYAYIKLKHPEKKVSQTWHGPTYPLRTQFKTIRHEKCCFILPENVMKTFVHQGTLKFTVDIRKTPRRSLKGVKLPGEDSETAVASSLPAEYNRPPSFYEANLTEPSTNPANAALLEANNGNMGESSQKPPVKQQQRLQRTRTPAIGILKNFRSASLNPSMVNISSVAPPNSQPTLNNDDEDLPEKNFIDKIPSKNFTNNNSANNSRINSTKSCLKFGL